MAGAQLGDDVSIINLDDSKVEVHDDSYGKRCAMESVEFKYSNNRLRNQKKCDPKDLVPEMFKEDLIPETHSQRYLGMARGSPQEATRGKGDGDVTYLRDKVSSLFRENCGLKEQAAKLAIDNRFLQKQETSLKRENSKLRDRLQQYSHQLKCFVQDNDTNNLVLQPNSHSFYKNSTSSDELNEHLKPTKNGSSDFPHSKEKTDFIQLQTLENKALSDEDERREKELEDTLETCQRNCKLMKQTVHTQNKLLKELLKRISSMQSFKAVSTQLDARNVIGNSFDTTLQMNAVETPRTTFINVDKYIHDFAPYLKNYTGEPYDKLVGGEYQDNGTQAFDDDRICPMCQAAFPKEIPGFEFETHVMDHFKSDEFEIIPSDGDYRK